MSWGAVIVGGAAVVSSVIASNSASKATDSQKNAAKSELALQQYQYDTSRSDLAPFMANELKASNINLGALQNLYGKIQAGPGDFKASEGYDWTLGEGVNALDKSAVAGGVSRNADTIRFGQGLASNEYKNFLDQYYQSLEPYQSIARVPTGSTAQGVNLNQTYANQAGNAFSQIGTANAQNAVAQGNIQNNALQNLTNGYLYYYGKKNGQA